RDPRRRDLLALAVEATDKAHLRHQVLGPVADEVKDAVLLANLRRLHGRSYVSRLPGGRTGANIKENRPVSPDGSKPTGRAGGERERLQHFGGAPVLDERDDTGIGRLRFGQ